MKKKLVSVLLCAAMVTGLLAGCGKSGDDDKKSGDGEKETITMWCPPLDDNLLENWEPLLEDFKEENNCEIDIQVQPWENYEEKWSSGAASGELPDIGYMYAEMFRLTLIPERLRI